MPNPKPTDRHIALENEAVERVALDANVMLIDGAKELEKKTESENNHTT